MSQESKFMILCFAVFLGFLCIGIPLPILPEFVNGELGFSMIISGVAIGLQSIVTVLTRQYAGRSADTIGAKPTTQRGFIACVISAFFYLISAHYNADPIVSISSLFIGRGLLGFGESLMLTGILTWGIELLGQSSSGKVMSWNGIAMYGAISVGAPLGLFVYSSNGFTGIAWLFFVLSGTALMIVSLFNYEGISKPLTKPSFIKTVKTIWPYGLGYALAGVGFGALSAFISVFFKLRGWENVEWALICFGLCYILIRVFFGHLPDKTGGAPVAIVSGVIELVGLLLLWQAKSWGVALLGVCFVGIGFSLLFPAFGVQALKKVSPESKGTALGAFSSFFDITLGITGPACGLIISYLPIENIYLFASVCCFATLILAIKLRKT